MAALPSQTDDSFNKFLNDLKKQNTESFATQLLQLKYEREIAKEDGDKREQQLNKLIESSEKIEKALTGFTGKNLGNNISSKKLSDVSIQNKEKTFKELGKEFAGIFGYKGGGNEAFTAEKDRYSKEFERQGKGSAKEGMLDYEKRIKEEKLEIEAERFGFERSNKLNEPNLKPTPAKDNPAADNVESPAELQIKVAKEDLEISKKSKTIFEQQLFELKSIREALGGAKPSGKGESRAKPQAAVAEKEKEESGGPGLLDMLPSKKSLGLGKLGAGLKGAWAGGGSTIAAGAAMVATPFLADAGLGALGFGQNKIDEKQDDANWQRASFLEKLQSAPARGLEKVGGLFGGTIANEARAKRIKSETEFLNKKYGQAPGEKTKEAVSGQARPAPISKEQKFFESIKDLPADQREQEIEKFSDQYAKDTNSATMGLTAKENLRSRAMAYDAGVNGGNAVVQDMNTVVARTGPDAAVETKAEESKSFGTKIKEFFGFGKEGEPPLEGRQAGGPVSKGEPYIVGEAGPEIVVPNEGGKVDNNAEYERVAAQAKEINQKFGKMPEGEMIDGVIKRSGKNNTYKISGPFGAYEYSSGGSFISYSSPNFSGLSAKITSKEEGGIEAGGGSIEHSYGVGPLHLKSKTSLSGDTLSQSASYTAGGSTLTASQIGTGPLTTEIKSLGDENGALRDMMTASGGGSQPVVVNNISGGQTAPNFVPMKASPRPDSSLNRYQDTVASY